VSALAVVVVTEIRKLLIRRRTDAPETPAELQPAAG
jgi:hypothetical protein